MFLSYLLKSRLGLTTLIRNQQGNQLGLAPKIGGNPSTKLFSDALYNDASIALIMFPLLASSVTLATLARDKYIHERAVAWCVADGVECSGEVFKSRKKLYHECIYRKGTPKLLYNVLLYFVFMHSSQSPLFINHYLRVIINPS